MKIEVRKNNKIVEIIERKVFHKGFLGNFIPHYARYKRKVYIVQGGIDYAYMHGEPSEVYIEVDEAQHQEEADKQFLRRIFEI